MKTTLEAPPMEKDELEKILANHYNIGALVSFERVKQGLANNMYFVETTSGKYSLRVSIKNNGIKVHYEVDLLTFIENLPTPKPIKTNSGEYLFDHKGYKSFVYPYIAGSSPTRVTSGMCKQIGEFLGKFHNQSKNFKSDIERTEFLNITPHRLKEMAGEARESVFDKRILETLEYVEKVIPNYQLSNNLPQGAIHTDLKPENSLFDDETLTGVLDFDNTYNGTLVFDLANTMSWFCAKNSKFDISCAKSMYQGYISERTLSKSEHENLYASLHHAYLALMLIIVQFIGRKWISVDFHDWAYQNMLEVQKNIDFTSSDLLKEFNYE